MVSLLCEIIVAICNQQKKDLFIEIEADWNFVLVHSLHTHKWRNTNTIWRHIN